jgi:hypothetical protein
MLQSEVIPPLETTRIKIKEQLSTVREYRILEALEKCMSQIPDVGNDTLTTLEHVKERLKERLKEVREYRPFRAIEETIAEIHNILVEAPSAAQPPAATLTSIATAPTAAEAVQDGEPLASIPDVDTARVA